MTRYSTGPLKVNTVIEGSRLHCERCLEPFYDMLHLRHFTSLYSTQQNNGSSTLQMLTKLMFGNIIPFTLGMFIV